MKVLQNFLNLLKTVVYKTEYTGPRVKIDGYEIEVKLAHLNYLIQKEVIIKIEI